MKNENTSFANISIPSLRSCSQHSKYVVKCCEHVVKCCEPDLRKGIKILAKLVFSFSIIVFNMFKLLVILFIMKTQAKYSLKNYLLNANHTNYFFPNIYYTFPWLPIPLLSFCPFC